MQYKVYIPELKNDDPVKKLVSLGLLTEDEADILKPSGSRVRDNLLTWIGTEVMNGFRDGTLVGLAEHTFMDNLAQARGNMMFFHGNNFYPTSNLWTAMVQFAVDLWIMILCITAPFKQYARAEPALGHWGCAQPWVCAATFPVVFAFLGAMKICTVLQRPFTSPIDTLNIDALITGTEETLFANLRSAANLHEVPSRVAGGRADYTAEKEKVGKDIDDLADEGTTI
mmetsp:Transcript_107053/g.175443  ORF Transcript_107053/g.175443 Transcript_107053/m.175443 type:complete len:227 (-) Transcript_107053:211-891(-)